MSMTMAEQFPELAAFERDFNPSSGGRKPGLDTLPDGDHDFEILSAELTRTEKTNEAIFRMELRVLGGGVVEHVYFFRTQMNVDILGGDLCTLGFDADQWKPPQRPLARELANVAPRLRGVRFRGKKVTNPKKDDPNKKYANLYVNQRLAADAPPPAYNPQPAYADPFATAGSNDSEIPF